MHSKFILHLINKTFLIAFAVMLTVTLSYVTLLERSPGIDFYQYWVANKIVKDRNINFYNSKNRQELAKEYFTKAVQENNSRLQIQAAFNRKDELRLSSTPFLYATFSFLTLKDYEIDIQTFRFLSSLMAVVCILYFSYIFNFSLFSAGLFSLFYLLFFEPYSSDIRVGNVNQIQLFFLSLFSLCLQKVSSTRTFLAGVIFGLMLLYKPTVIVILPFLIISWLIRKRLKDNLLFASGIIFGTFLAYYTGCLFLENFSAWKDWFLVSKELQSNNTYSLSEGNFTLLNVFKELFYNFNYFKITTIIIFLFGILVTIYSSLNTAKKEARLVNEFEFDFLVVNLSILTFFLVSSLVWLHYYILLVPLFIFHLYKSYEDNRKLLFFTLLAFILLTCAPHKLIVFYNAFVASIAILSGLVILYSMTIYRLQKIK